MDREQLKLLSN
jgi:hypothetical protein